MSYFLRKFFSGSTITRVLEMLAKEPYGHHKFYKVLGNFGAFPKTDGFEDLGRLMKWLQQNYQILVRDLRNYEVEE